MGWVLLVVLVVAALAALWWWMGRRSREVGATAADRAAGQPRDGVDAPLIPPIAPLPGGGGVAPIAPVPPLIADPGIDGATSEVADTTGSTDPDKPPDDPVDRRPRPESLSGERACERVSWRDPAHSPSGER